jgi:hypothetical protein
VSRVLPFPKFAGPAEPPRKPTPTEQWLASFDETRREARKRWRHEKRTVEPVARRAIVTVGYPPTDDVYAAYLWGLGCGLLTLAEHMLHTSVRLTGKSDKVLRRYIRTVREQATHAERCIRKQRARRR